MSDLISNIYCVSHKSPIFSIAKKFKVVSPEKSSFLCIQDDYFGDVYSGDILSEYTQLFALSDFLKKDNDEFVHLFQYRKFVSDLPNLKSSSNIGYLKYCKSKEADILIKFYEDKILTTSPLKIESTISNYKQFHIEEDFLGLILSMKKFGFHDDDLKRFTDLDYLFPTPSLGSYPREFFIETMNILRDVWFIFFNEFYQKRTGYQRRVGGFLLERLHSFLLANYLTITNIPYIHGNIVVVTEDDIIHVTN